MKKEIICINCKSKMLESYNYCTQCGNKLDKLDSYISFIPKEFNKKYCKFFEDNPIKCHVFVRYMAYLIKYEDEYNYKKLIKSIKDLDNISFVSKVFDEYKHIYLIGRWDYRFTPEYIRSSEYNNYVDTYYKDKNMNVGVFVKSGVQINKMILNGLTSYENKRYDESISYIENHEYHELIKLLYRIGFLMSYGNVWIRDREYMYWRFAKDLLNNETQLTRIKILEELGNLSYHFRIRDCKYRNNKKEFNGEFSCY